MFFITVKDNVGLKVDFFGTVNSLDEARNVLISNGWQPVKYDNSEFRKEGMEAFIDPIEDMSKLK